MNYLKYTFLIPLMASALSSCSDEEDREGVPGGDPVTFVAAASEFSTRTNAEGNGWTKGDQIGVYMLNDDNTAAYDKSVNRPYTCETDGSSAPFSSVSPLYMPDGKSVNFIAYYPYGGTVSNNSYRILLADQSEGTGTCDLMYSRVDGQTSGNNVSLPFSHQLTKVIFRFVDKDQQAIEADGSVQIKGMAVAGNFNLLSGELTSDNSIESTIITYNKEEDKNYEAIIMPSDVTPGYTVSGTIEGKAFEWSFTNTDVNLPTLQKGYKYVFTIPFENGNPGTARVEQISSGIGASPWNGGGETSGMSSAVNYTTFPESSTAGAFTDTELKLTFEGNAPKLGNEGYIRIRRSDNDAIVDEINMGEREVQIKEGVTTLNSWMDIIGVTPKDSKTNRKRVVNYHPVQIQGNTVIIKPHSNRLAYGTTYYVTIDRKAILQSGFKGISNRRWLFATKNKPAATTRLTVSHSNPQADFYTLQGAIDYFAANTDRNTAKSILMENGTYQEIINLRDQDNLTVKGEDRDKVNIQYDNRDALNPGVNDGMDIEQSAPLGTVITKSGNRSVLMIAGNADQIRFENMTIENTSGNAGQAEALILRNNADCATQFINCNFYGYQDTMIGGGGYNWFYNCLVTGATDFIWGGPVVSLFEKCELRSIANGRTLNARVKENNLGYVFSDCRFTATGNVTDRSLIFASTNDNLTFLNTTFSGVYKLEEAPTPAVPTLENGLKLYNCKNEKGQPALETLGGAQYFYILSDAEFKSRFADRQTILKGYKNVSWFNE